jgi:hypothetical protein
MHSHRHAFNKLKIVKHFMRSRSDKFAPAADEHFHLESGVYCRHHGHRTCRHSC